jgi:hypothetical protein
MEALLSTKGPFQLFCVSLTSIQNTVKDEKYCHVCEETIDGV